MFRVKTSRMIGIVTATVAVAASTATFTFAADQSRTEREGLIRANAEGVKAQASVVQAQSQIITAVGQARKAAAEARKTLEECRSTAIDNSVKAVKALYEKRRERELYKASHARPPLSREDRLQISQARLPKRLNEIGGTVLVSLSSASNEIAWPATFQKPEFDRYRLQIDVAFAQRSYANSGVGSELHRDVYYLTKQMHAELKTQKGNMPPSEFTAALRLLRSLSYETRFPPTPPRLASN